MALVGREKQLVLSIFSSIPYLSMFELLSLTAKLDLLPNHPTTNKYSRESYWWKNERIRRRLILSYPQLDSYRERLYDKENALRAGLELG